MRVCEYGTLLLGMSASHVDNDFSDLMIFWRPYR